MVTTTRRFADETECESGARKRRCQRSCGQLTTNSVSQQLCGDGGGNRDPAEEFLHQFALAQGTQNEGNGPVTELVWRCFAECNVMLRAQAQKLRDLPLCGYLSLTRCKKAEVFGKLLMAEGLHAEQPGLWPVHTHLVSTILQRLHFNFEDASICRYTVKRSDWMLPWCQKWGFLSSDVSFFAVNGYYDEGGELQAGPSQLNRTLFVPVMGI